MVPSFKSRVSCTFSNWIFRSKNIISLSALQLEGVFFQYVASNFYHGDRMLIVERVFII